MRPVVHLVSTLYETGVKLSQQEMRLLEKRFQRLEGLKKWFVLINPLTQIKHVQLFICINLKPIQPYEYGFKPNQFPFRT